MLIVISPAKTLDYKTPATTKKHTTPDFLSQSKKLIKTLKNYSPQDIATLMKVSDKIAALNVARYNDWKMPFTDKNAKQALLAFKGDVYTGLDAESFSSDEMTFAQSHLRILSGLYGLLKPLDLMQPYRLEMGTKLKTDAFKNLYEFWDNTITEAINNSISKQKDEKVLINLASNEYFKSVNPKEIKYDIITPIFKEKKDGQHKVVGLFAKKARGMMSRFIIQNKLKQAEDIKDFNEAGYKFSKSLSKNNEWVFTRKQP